jgi:hypothetical protein
MTEPATDGTTAPTSGTPATGTQSADETATTETAPAEESASGGGYLPEAPGSVGEPSEEDAKAAAEQFAKEQEWKADHPNEPLIGGELSFGGGGGTEEG